MPSQSPMKTTINKISATRGVRRNRMSSLPDGLDFFQRKHVSYRIIADIIT